MRAILVLAIAFALVPACVCNDAEKPKTGSEPSPKAHVPQKGPVSINRDRTRTLRLPENFSPPVVVDSGTPPADPPQ
jgi:hypothetical protein